ncbi:RNA polymerase II transcriptional coactivator KIWI-like [Wolffia australiana]
MWGKGKKRQSEESPEDAGDADRGPPKKKTAGGSDEDDTVVCEISKNRKVSVRSWQGKIVVDIREFYSKDGKDFPGKKGISLTLDQWNTLKDHIGEIDEAIAENA